MPAHFRQNAIYLLTISLLLSVFTLITFNVQNISARKKVLGAATSRVKESEKEKAFWIKFLEENPRYLEGWVQLAVLGRGEGNALKANESYLKAKEIDPNSDKLPW